MNNDLRSVLGNLSREIDVANSLLQNQDSSGSPSLANALGNARDTVRSLQSDSTLRNNISRSFTRSPSASTSGSTNRTTLPSVARGPGPSHRFNSSRQSTVPYGRRPRAREPRRYDMKLLVVDFIPELFAASSKGNISNYRGDAVIETPFFIMEDQTAVAVKNKVMAVIKNQYDDYGGQFVFASRRNRNFLSIAGEQDLDARGVHTLKGSGCVYVVLDTPVGPTDEEVSRNMHFIHFSGLICQDKPL